MFRRGGDDQVALLKRKARAWVLSLEGYGAGSVLGKGQRIEFLTPKTVVGVIRAGLRAQGAWVSGRVKVSPEKTNTTTE